MLPCSQSATTHFDPDLGAHTLQWRTITFHLRSKIPADPTSSPENLDMLFRYSSWVMDGLIMAKNG